jgi:hypothetical protein
VLSADTHSGSISSCITRGERPAHRSATVVVLAQRNPESRQPMAVRSNEDLSRHVQPRAVKMPASRSNGAGSRGSFNPPPSANRKESGRRMQCLLDIDTDLAHQLQRGRVGTDEDVLPVVQRHPMHVIDAPRTRPPGMCAASNSVTE